MEKKADQYLDAKRRATCINVPIKRNRKESTQFRKGEKKERKIPMLVRRLFIYCLLFSHFLHIIYVLILSIVQSR